MTLERFNTDYFNDSVMANQFVGTSLPSTFPPNGASGNLWVGLSTTIPDQQGNNVTEPLTSGNGNGYIRQPLGTASGYSQFGGLAPGIYGNTVGVQFPTATATWGSGFPIQAVCTFDDIGTSGHYGNLISVDTRVINPTVVTTSNPMPYIPPYALRVGVNSGWGRKGLISEAAADSIAQYCYLGAANSTPTTYVALCAQVPLSSDTDISSSREILVPYANSGNYTRLHITYWHKIKGGRYANSGSYQFSSAAAVWGTPVAVAIVNGAGTSIGNVGQLLFAGLLNPPTYIDQNNICPPFLANQVQVYLE